jgi:FAD/FMN-containing dehydrogenase
MMTLSSKLAAIVGPAGCVSVEDSAPYLQDRRGRFEGKALCIVRPSSTQEVARVVTACVEAGVSIVPQGGNTGLVTGSVTDTTGEQVLLSLSRMNIVREVDPLNFTMTVEAGCILQDLQTAAENVDRLLPLSLAAQGSCQIGGNLSTNAGGVQVLRYGNARDLVLGLEVVLADGRIWNGLRALRKDNTGYDLKQCFLGAEGTLGIITAAVLKLFPRPVDPACAMVAVASPEAATKLLTRLQGATGGLVSTFEYMNGECVRGAVEAMDGNRNPLSDYYPHTALIEIGATGEASMRALETTLESAFEDGSITDAVVAQNETQRQALWRIRESIPEAQGRLGAGIKHDVSVAVSRVPELLARGSELLNELVPEGIVMAFGHMGDGNLHFNLNQPGSMPRDAFMSHAGRVNRAMHDLVMSMDGSFSAEHGIGTIKRDDLERYAEPVELGMMRALKQALDPMGTLNPQVMLPPKSD